MSRENDTVVLLGGESEEREISFQSGNNIAEALRGEGIAVDTYDWHPERMQEFLSLGYKRVFIALHGGSGENGTVQAMLTLAGIPFRRRMCPCPVAVRFRLPRSKRSASRGVRPKSGTKSPKKSVCRSL